MENNNVLDDPILIFKIVIWIFEISIEKLIFICLKKKSNLFSLDNLLKLLKNEVYYFSNSNDVYSEIVKINNNIMNEDNNSKENSEEFEYFLHKKDSNFDKSSKYLINYDDNIELIYNIISYISNLEDIEIEENTDNEIISVELPITLIVQQILESEYIENFGNSSRILNDLDIINEIWNEWNPSTNLFRDLKNLINSINKHLKVN